MPWRSASIICWYLVGGRLGAPGQGTHFVGDYGESTTIVSGPRRFDGGIQRQQVSLFGDTANHRKNAADGLAVPAQDADRLGRMIQRPGQGANTLVRSLHPPLPLGAECLRLQGKPDGIAGTAGHFTDGGAELFHRRTDRIEGLLLPLGRAVAAAEQLAGTLGMAGDPAAAVAEARHHRCQACLQQAIAQLQLADFIDPPGVYQLLDRMFDEPSAVSHQLGEGARMQTQQQPTQADAARQQHQCEGWRGVRGQQAERGER
ncbi:hypothetical protein SSTU70S_00522 [Stutzerimonas stutzeri]